jgi:hypothetical protein
LRVFGSRLLAGLAWLNVAIHGFALVLAWVGMRPGSTLEPLPQRMAYLAGHPVAWTLGWIAWMLSAAALIAFLAVLTWQTEKPLAQLGLMIALVGAGFDLFCDCLYVLLLPRLASGGTAGEGLFLSAEQATGIASLVIANGAYSVAVLLVSHACRALPGVSRFTTLLGYGVGCCGLVLAAGGITGSAWHAALATPPTIGLFCLWVVLLAHSLEPGRRAP